MADGIGEGSVPQTRPLTLVMWKGVTRGGMG